MERDHKLDFLRALAIIGVLVIHSATRYAGSELERAIGIWFTVVASPCIALFLFVSGALFRQDQDVSYLKHRMKRILCPYLVFSTFALIYIYKASLPAIVADIKVVLLKILTGGIFNIYYFVFVITCIYIISYLLDKLGFLEKYIISIFLVSLMVNLLHASYFRQLCDYVGVKDKWRNYYYLRTLLIWFPFYFFGICYRFLKLEKTILEKKILIRVIWAFIFVFYSLLHFMHIDNIAGHNSVIGTTYSLTTILFLLTFNIRNEDMCFISKISYSMYLSHIFFVYMLKDVSSLLFVKVPFSFSLISFILSFTGSLFVYYIVKLVFKSRSLYIIGA